MSSHHYDLAMNNVEQFKRRAEQVYNIKDAERAARARNGLVKLIKDDLDFYLNQHLISLSGGNVTTGLKHEEIIIVMDNLAELIAFFTFVKEGTIDQWKRGLPWKKTEASKTSKVEVDSSLIAGKSPDMAKLALRAAGYDEPVIAYVLKKHFTTSTGFKLTHLALGKLLRPNEVLEDESHKSHSKKLIKRAKGYDIEIV